MRRLAILLILAIAAALAGTAFLARASFRREEVSIPTGWPAKALEDDTLVLERWLAAQGWRVRRDGGAFAEAALPSGGLLVLLRTSPTGLREVDADRLMAWVRAGGHLVVDASAAPLNDARGTAALLRRLGVELVDLPPDQRPPAELTETFNEDGSQYALRASGRWRLKIDLEAWDWRMGSDLGQLHVRRREGQGTVLISADLSYFYNDRFPDLDHAAWTARMLGAPAPGAEAVVWSRPVEPSLLAWLWRKAWAFFLACAVLLAAWLWRGFWRFGPWLPEAPTARRSLLEHLVATGRFLWRQGGGPEALAAVSRRAVLRRAERLHPAFAILPEAERWAFLAARASLPEGDIADALDDRPGATPETLGRRLQILLHLHQRLLP